MDAFFAAVELMRHPELKGKAVVVGGTGDPMKRGVVSTASYEARKFGIHSGMPLRTAYKICPEAIFLPVDYPTYANISKKIKTILRGFSPMVQDAGLDEAFLDMSHIGQPPDKIAKAIKQHIKSETGLTCSIGIAPNKLLAKIASDLDKPDGLTIITERGIEGRIWPLPVKKIWGVGPKTEEYLARLGVKTIGDLASLSLDTLITQFGQAHGNYLYLASRGIDESPVVSHREPKSISRETTFQKDVGDWQILARVLARLTQDVVTRMKALGYRCRTITVKLRFADFKTHTRTMTLAEPTDALGTVRQAGFKCLNRIALVKRVRLIGMRVSGLEKKKRLT